MRSCAQHQSQCCTIEKFPPSTSSPTRHAPCLSRRKCRSAASRLPSGVCRHNNPPPPKQRQGEVDE